MKRFALMLGGLALLAGCREDTPTDTTQKTLVLASTVEQDLHTLRRVTAPFSDFALGQAAGYSTEITPCMSDPALGGMGFHYGNVGLIDGAVQVDQPELLLYEPQANGRLKFVAVEYIIPYTFVPRVAQPPVLFGQPFAQVDAFQLWGLHVWIAKKNPSGLFAPWNPTVSCSNTSDVSVMHH
jgi:hypothetical protein